MLSNRAFAYIRTEEYGSAIADASAAIAADPKLPKVRGVNCQAPYRRSNRGAQVHHFRVCHRSILICAEVAQIGVLSACRCHVQGYYRRGDANFALGHFKPALKDFQRAARLSPKDPDLRRKLTECERIVKRMRFEESLAMPVRHVVRMLTVRFPVP